jgi:CRISPR system Cascade subunit CasA
MHYHLLKEPLFHVTGDYPGGNALLSLVEVFKGLETDTIDSFDHLQLHQEHGWYSFLVQLSVLARRSSGQSMDVMWDAAYWLQALQMLTKDFVDDAPWHLIVEDLTQPAFMQPPTCTSHTQGWNTCCYPDDMDILQLAKSHDVKRERIYSPCVDHWIYALVNLQTMQGFSGAKNYGISRMNSGFGNRPCVAATSSLRWGQRWRGDMQRLTGRSQDGCCEDDYEDDERHALLWTVPWDGSSQLGVDEVADGYIEVCRRLRCCLSGDKIHVRSTGSSCERIAAKQLFGNTQDPWTPILQSVDKETKEPTLKALTVDKNGFNYRQLQRLLFDGSSKANLLQKPPRQAGEYVLYCWAMTRGQGKTEGLHRRSLPIPQRIQGYLEEQGSDRDNLARIACERVKQVDAVAEALRRALAIFAAEQPTEHSKSQGLKSANLPKNAEKEFESYVDAVFFADLWREYDQQDGKSLWQVRLSVRAKQIFDSFIEHYANKRVAFYRAYSLSKKYLDYQLYKHQQSCQ